MRPSEPVAIQQGEAACIELAVGDTLRIEQTTGGQCVDLIAWGAGDRRERFSPAITRSREGGSPGIGASLWSAWPRERALLEIIADAAPGHDLLHPACTSGEYERIGVRGEPSCASVQSAAAATWDLGPDLLPDPFNLWFRSTLSASGEIDWQPTQTNAGDHLEVRALVDCLVVVNPCVDDVFGCSTTVGGSIIVTHRCVTPALSLIRVVGAPVTIEKLHLRLGAAATTMVDAMPDDLTRAQAVRRGAIRHALRSDEMRVAAPGEC